jgi:hypothetical protein
MADVISGAETAYPSEVSEFTPDFLCFVDRCLSFCPFSFGYCIVFPSSIYGFWYHFSIFKLFLNGVYNNSTNIDNTNNWLSLEIIKHNADGNPGPGLGRVTTYGVILPINEIQIRHLHKINSWIICAFDIVDKFFF